MKLYESSSFIRHFCICRYNCPDEQIEFDKAYSAFVLFFLYEIMLVRFGIKFTSLDCDIDYTLLISSRERIITSTNNAHCSKSTLKSEMTRDESFCWPKTARTHNFSVFEVKTHCTGTANPIKNPCLPSYSHCHTIQLQTE